MRFSCPNCQAIFQTASGGAAQLRVACAGCGAEMIAAVAEPLSGAPLSGGAQPSGGAQVLELHPDRIPTRRYDLHELRARLEEEREASRPPPAETTSPFAPPHLTADGTGDRQLPNVDQVWFVGVQGRKVGPLSPSGLDGLRARGLLTAASLVWREGWPVWAAAEAVPELRSTLGLPLEQVPPGAPASGAPPSLPQLPSAPPTASELRAAPASLLSLPFGLDDVTDPHSLPLPQQQPPPPPPVEDEHEDQHEAQHDAQHDAHHDAQHDAHHEAQHDDHQRQEATDPGYEPPFAALVREVAQSPGTKQLPATLAQASPAASTSAPPPPPSGLTPVPTESAPNLSPLPPRRRRPSSGGEARFGAVADEPRSSKPLAIGLALLIAALGLGVLIASRGETARPPARDGTSR